MRAGANLSQLRGVLFDWDGTLLNSYAADSAAYLAMFRELEIPWGLEELERHYSPDWYSVYRAANLPRQKWKTAEKLWQVHYARHAPQLLPGARRVLSLLARRHALGLVTSGSRERVVRQLRTFGLWERFLARVCSEDTRVKKPHPAPLRLAMRQMGLRARETVYVGDSPEDMEMARSAGVRAIAVLGPFPTEKRLRAAKPEVLLESIAELPTALLGLRS
jgi:phosphoglycolate phosphatase